jgi:hypothetical protein
MLIIVFFMGAVVIGLLTTQEPIVNASDLIIFGSIGVACLFSMWGLGMAAYYVFTDLWYHAPRHAPRHARVTLYGGPFHGATLFKDREGMLIKKNEQYDVVGLYGYYVGVADILERSPDVQYPHD